MYIVHVLRHARIKILSVFKAYKISLIFNNIWILNLHYLCKDKNSFLCVHVPWEKKTCFESSFLTNR